MSKVETFYFGSEVEPSCVTIKEIIPIVRFRLQSSASARVRCKWAVEHCEENEQMHTSQMTAQPSLAGSVHSLTSIEVLVGELALLIQTRPGSRRNVCKPYDALFSHTNSIPALPNSNFSNKGKHEKSKPRTRVYMVILLERPGPASEWGVIVATQALQARSPDTVAFRREDDTTCEVHALPLTSQRVILQLSWKQNTGNHVSFARKSNSLGQLIRITLYSHKSTLSQDLLYLYRAASTTLLHLSRPPLRHMTLERLLLELIKQSLAPLSE